MRRNVPLCVGQTDKKRRNGCQTKFNKYFLTTLARVYCPGLKVRGIGATIWSSAVLLSQPASKGLRRGWIVADDIRGNLGLLRMRINAPTSAMSASA